VKWDEAKAKLKYVKSRRGAAQHVTVGISPECAAAVLAHTAELERRNAMHLADLRKNEKIFCKVDRLLDEIPGGADDDSSIERAAEWVKAAIPRLTLADALAGADRSYDTARVLVANAKADLCAGRSGGMTLNDAELEHSRAIRERAAALSAYRGADGGGRDG